MELTGAQLVIKLLERQGVTTIAGIPGGANLPLYDALRDSSIRHILARHEQGAGFIAQGMARVTGRAEVCFGTSGPAATNLLTAIADAKLDSVPLVAITGQVPTSMIGADAFQEVDTYGLSLPITKHNFLVRDAAELIEIVPWAFRIALEGRPGPVLIDVPKDVQRQSTVIDNWPEPGRRPEPPAGAPAEVARLADMIRCAERPVLYAGGGIVASKAAGELRQLARKNGIPVVCTLMGLGAFPADDPLYLGMLGMHGARHTNFALEEADLLVVLGARFDDRAIGKAAAFCPGARIAHVDIDAAELDKIRPADLGLKADVGGVLRSLLPLLPPDSRSDWNGRIGVLRTEHPSIEAPEDVPLHPLNIIRAVAEAVPRDTVVTTDVGQHQMWVAQAYPFSEPRTFLTSAGLGTMGFGLPAAIGAALALPGKRVVCFTGDGSFLMNNQELAVVADHNLPVTIVLLNNGHLGLVRQQQELFYGERYHAVRFESQTDFAALARAFGVPGFRLAEGDSFEQCLGQALEQEGPNLIEVPVRADQNVFPMVPPGGANREMIGGSQHV